MSYIIVLSTAYDLFQYQNATYLDLVVRYNRKLNTGFMQSNVF
jgi:hypothetical protein